MKSLLVFIGILLIANLGFSQYTLLMLNGEKISLRNYKYNDMGTAITYHSSNREVSEIDLDYIFSIIDTSGTELIIYKPDTTKDDFMKVDQMRNFIMGEIAAKEKYKCPWCYIGGFAVGAASPFLAPLIGLNYFYAPLLPAAGSSGVGFTSASKQMIQKQNPKDGVSEHFIMGYKEVSSQVRLKNTIIGSGLGLLAGFLTVVIINNH